MLRGLILACAMTLVAVPPGSAQRETDVAFVAATHLLASRDSARAGPSGPRRLVLVKGDRTGVRDSELAARLGAVAGARSAWLTCGPDQAVPEARRCTLPQGVALLSVTVEHLAADSAIVSVGIREMIRDRLLLDGRRASLHGFRRPEELVPPPRRGGGGRGGLD